ncbi:hypothetical protein GCM10009733_098450 [Nonomuraea maheshkhaliensis]|uniref:Holin n=1 Tax=Nonomuraea maheshkhaliensis TaxID=419590 RepID=A0ABP4TCY8_9ACTN
MAVFAIVMAACGDTALNFREYAEVLNLGTGIDPWIVAAAFSLLTGKAFDRLYPPDEDE